MFTHEDDNLDAIELRKIIKDKLMTFLYMGEEEAITCYEKYMRQYTKHSIKKTPSNYGLYFNITYPSDWNNDETKDTSNHLYKIIVSGLRNYEQIEKIKLFFHTDMIVCLFLRVVHDQISFSHSSLLLF